MRSSSAQMPSSERPPIAPAKLFSNRFNRALNLEQSLPVFPAPEESGGDALAITAAFRKNF